MNKRGPYLVLYESNHMPSHMVMTRVLNISLSLTSLSTHIVHVFFTPWPCLRSMHESSFSSIELRGHLIPTNFISFHIHHIPSHILSIHYTFFLKHLPHSQTFILHAFPIHVIHLIHYDISTSMHAESSLSQVIDNECPWFPFPQRLIKERRTFNQGQHLYTGTTLW